MSFSGYHCISIAFSENLKILTLNLIVMVDYSKKTVLLSQNTNVAQNVAKIKSSEDKFFVANHSQM